MRHFSILHTHRFGHTHTVIQSEQDLMAHWVSMEEDEQEDFVRNVIQLDWEPELDEGIFIDEVDLNDMKFVAW